MAERDQATQQLLQRWQELKAACQEAHARRVAAAGQGEQPHGPVRLLAASKHQPVHKLMALYDAGQRDFAENYLQELQQKAAALHASGRRPRWHLIGTLQRNKAQAAADTGALVHTVASTALARKLSARAQANGRAVSVLVQVRDPAAPKTRAGVAEEELHALAEAVAALPQLRLMGLMVLPDPHAPAHEAFARLRAQSMQVRRLPGCAQATELSMGMSHDFRAAILEGATMVRVGSALFGPRP